MAFIQKLKHYWQEPELKSLSIILLGSGILLSVGAWLPSQWIIADIYTRMAIVFGGILLWAIIHWLRLAQQTPVFSSQKNESPESAESLIVVCQQVRENVQAAEQFLKSQLSAGITGFAAFQRVPWYMVIGEREAGKTTLISRSELNFIATEQFVEFNASSAITGGQVNWWFTSKAVLLDIPGYYLAQTGEQNMSAVRAGWIELLQQIKRLRRRRPLEGIVLVINALSLLSQQNGEENINHLRRRLQEIFYYFKQRLPIYVVCSQADKIPGFNAYFNDLGKQEREQLLGMTFSLALKGRWAETFSQTFDQLLQNLQQRALWRLHHEPDPKKYQEVLQFPHQLHFIKENLQQQLYGLSQLKQQFALRGIYFSSATAQADSSSDNRLQHTVNKTFALTTPSQHLARWQPGHAFFIKDLFQQRIFPESAMVCDVLHRNAKRPSGWGGWLMLGLAGGVIISSVVMLSTRYQQQTYFLTRANSALTNYQLLTLNTQGKTLTLVQTLPLLNTLSMAQENAVHADLPWLLQLQLHYSQPLTLLLQKIYLNELHTHFLPALQNVLTQQLLHAAPADPNLLYNLLKAYLMLSDSKYADVRWLEQWLVEQWASPLRKNSDFAQHVQALFTMGWPSSTPDNTLLTNVRAQLNALPYAELSNIIYSSQLPRENFSPPIDANVDNVFILPAEGIMSIYTPAEFIRADNLITQSLQIAINGNWILGNKSASGVSVTTIQNLRELLINQYAQDYAQAWQNWLTHIQLRPIASLTQLSHVLHLLTSAHSPLLNLLQMIVRYTNAPAFSERDSVLKAALIKNLQVPFADMNNLYQHKLVNGFALKTLFTNLMILMQQIDAVNHAPKPSLAAWQVVNQYLQQPQNVIAQLLAIAKSFPAPLQQWISVLALQSQALLINQAQNYIQVQWQPALQLCEQAAQQYPLQSNAMANLSLSAFSQLFGTQGVIQQFYQQILSPWVNTDAARWEWRTLNGVPISDNAQVLTQFERAHIIQALYFNAANQLSFPFKMQLVNLDDQLQGATFNLGGQQFESAALLSNQVHGFNWPSSAQTANLTLIDKKGITHTLIAQGEWSLFRLLDQAQAKTQLDHQTLNALFNIDGYKAEYYFTGSSPLHPFMPSVITQFQCPRWN